MGLFQSNQFPYTDLQNLNIGWVLETVKSNLSRIETLEQEFSGYVNTAKQYTDEQIELLRAETENEINALRQSTNTAIAQLRTYTDGKFAEVDAELVKIVQDTDAKIQASNARTDEAIRQNNEYLLGVIGEELGQAKIVNFFTGELVSIQDMFDILAQFHLADSITYTELAARNIDYTAFAALNITYSELVNNGGALVPQS